MKHREPSDPHRGNSHKPPGPVPGWAGLSCMLGPLGNAGLLEGST